MQLFPLETFFLHFHTSWFCFPDLFMGFETNLSLSFSMLPALSVLGLPTTATATIIITVIVGPWHFLLLEFLKLLLGPFFSLCLSLLASFLFVKQC